MRVSWQLFRASVESRAAKNLRPKSVGECTLEVEFNLGISSGPLIGAVGGRGVIGGLNSVREGVLVAYTGNTECFKGFSTAL